MHQYYPLRLWLDAYDDEPSCNILGFELIGETDRSVSSPSESDCVTLALLLLTYLLEFTRETLWAWSFLCWKALTSSSVSLDTCRTVLAPCL